MCVYTLSFFFHFNISISQALYILAAEEKTDYHVKQTQAFKTSDHVAENVRQRTYKTHPDSDTLEQTTSFKLHFFPPPQ